MSQGRTAVESPGNVGGRRAHPPRPEKNWAKKVNKKERRRARNSALSATSEPDLIVKTKTLFFGNARLKTHGPTATVL